MFLNPNNFFQFEFWLGAVHKLCRLNMCWFAGKSKTVPTFLSLIFYPIVLLMSKSQLIGDMNYFLGSDPFKSKVQSYILDTCLHYFILWVRRAAWSRIPNSLQARRSLSSISTEINNTEIDIILPNSCAILNYKFQFLAIWAVKAERETFILLSILLLSKLWGCFSYIFMGKISLVAELNRSVRS